jgi:hypothetical protein
MRMLSWLAERFSWQAADKTLDWNVEQEMSGDVEKALVAFIQLEERDAENRASVFRKTLKQIKWQANKKGFRRIVLHSFAHLGSRESASPEFAWDFLVELAERLRNTGYEVWITPFGYTCDITLSVGGDPIARVWKEI